MLQMFYQSVVASTIFFAVVSWGAGIKAKDANRLNKLIKKAGSVVGSKLVTLEEVVEHRMLAKLLVIMDNVSHPLHETLDKLKSSFSNRLIQPRCLKELIGPTVGHLKRLGNARTRSGTFLFGVFSCVGSFWSRVDVIGSD